MLPTADRNEYLSHLHRLLHVRWIMLAVMAVLILLTPALLDIALPQTVLLLILGVGIAVNAIGQHYFKHQPSASASELCSQLMIDIGTLSALMFFSGGATNPLVSLLLPPVAIAALCLPRHQVVLVGTTALAAYSLLMLFYLPLSIANATRATQLHLIGMWLTFSVSTLLIGWIILRMSQLIRQRDAELASAREQALRDERVVAMGTLAAGAAHELGTPLATMALIAGELAHDPQQNPAARADLALLRQQIGICKDIISGLAHRADAERLENPLGQPVDRWIDTLRLRWQALRPEASSRLIVACQRPAPAIADDPRLEQALLNLLNNGANVARKPLEIRLTWTATRIDIEIRDDGPGFPAAVLEVCGSQKLPSHEGGCGIGLLLTRSAVEQLGGSLHLSNPDDGGALACLQLPVAAS